MTHLPLVTAVPKNKLRVTDLPRTDLSSGYDKAPEFCGGFVSTPYGAIYWACCASLFRRRYAACQRALPGLVLAFRRFAEAKEKERRNKGS
jgi:hypothetical protein